jgi:hypothetical protein
MLQFSFILAIITFIAFALIWIKLPLWAKKHIARWPLLFDIILSAAVYLFLGQTLIALMAAGFFAILISLYLLIAKGIYFPQQNETSGN